MIELVFVACIVSAKQDCREHSLVYLDITPMVCLMAAQPELAKWVQTHPAHRIKSWKCRGLENAERDA
ncbi:hypothetical protein [Sedimentitalea nanhaiensis]|uniref:Uncharacterized protein n=1 Tax=Sedimentitalea nanhaiensis TaxID=999627 RepID=A0A1I7E6V8_9RHOB|nr:hypothetical protein [Sedimentitalea nanhaiensis]SFU19652.1 hypothetical protein SAMN05216236_14716 [Sedimentitalea nanhaiensis]